MYFRSTEIQLWFGEYTQCIGMIDERYEYGFGNVRTQIWTVYCNYGNDTSDWYVIRVSWDDVQHNAFSGEPLFVSWQIITFGRCNWLHCRRARILMFSSCLSCYIVREHAAHWLMIMTTNPYNNEMRMFSILFPYMRDAQLVCLLLLLGRV